MEYCRFVNQSESCDHPRNTINHHNLDIKTTPHHHHQRTSYRLLLQPGMPLILFSNKWSKFFSIHLSNLLRFVQIFHHWQQVTEMATTELRKSVYRWGVLTWRHFSLSRIRKEFLHLQKVSGQRMIAITEISLEAINNNITLERYASPSWWWSSSATVVEYINLNYNRIFILIWFASFFGQSIELWEEEKSYFFTWWI